LSTKKDYLTFIQFFYFSSGYNTELILQPKKKRFSQDQWFVIGVITIFVIVISNVVIAALLVRVDKIGIREIYQTKTGAAAQEWSFNTDNPRNDPRTGGENPHTKFVQKNSDLSA
jgi:hypothetical protein